MRTQRFAIHPQLRRHAPARRLGVPRRYTARSLPASAVRLLRTGLIGVALLAAGNGPAAWAGGLQPGIYLKDSAGDRIRGADNSLERALRIPAGLTVQEPPTSSRRGEKITRQDATVQQTETSLRPLLVGLLIFAAVELAVLWWSRRREKPQ